MLVYLGLSALAVFAFTLLLLLLGESPLAATHSVLAVAILPLIFGAITHFVPVLTRSSGAHRIVLSVPIALQISGFFVVLHFSGEIGLATLLTATGGSLLLTLGFAGWLISRARRTLGKPHPGWRWYLAAIVFLVIGLALVPAMYFWPEARDALRLLHMHVNTLGFVGLTAIGTLQVLMPTVLSGPDADAATRLREDLPLAVTGVLTVGLGAAFWWPLSLAGGALLLFVGGRLGISWLGRYGLNTILRDGASAALAVALCGFLVVLAFGVGHATGLSSGRDAIPSFVSAFLLPLVTGALSQLLPVWRYPGRRTPVRDHMRVALVTGGLVRAFLFGIGGISLAAGQSHGIWLSAAGVFSFLYVVIRAFKWFL